MVERTLSEKASEVSVYTLLAGSSEVWRSKIAITKNVKVDSASVTTFALTIYEVVRFSWEGIGKVSKRELGW